MCSPEFESFPQSDSTSASIDDGVGYARNEGAVKGAVVVRRGTNVAWKGTIALSLQGESPC